MQNLTTLKSMPLYSTTEVSYSYAKEAETVRRCLQIMMSLRRLCVETGRPLLPAHALMPKFVFAWNNKGPSDDMSHVLSTEELGLAEFDHTLKSMPLYSTTEVAHSYTKDAETARFLLQIMMCLWRLSMAT